MKLIKKILFHLDSFRNLFFPRLCIVCEKPIVRNEKYICVSCLYDIPLTKLHEQKDNIITQIFWGRLKIECGTALFFYSKTSNYSSLLYSLKYSGMKDLAFYLGQQLGAELQSSILFNDIDLIIPVPLHPKKKKIRGYNQSDWIVFGIADVFKREVCIDNLYRTVFTNTQTKKSRVERWENVAGKFALKDADFIKNKHILIVDDVLTTGATIEACAEVLLRIEGVKISIATLAKA
jgi:ComF family protein